MNNARSYLDYNATAPLRPEARESVMQTLDIFGNASSAHAEGRAAREVLDTARRQVAQLVGAEPANIVFTSGGSEANQMALSPYWLKQGAVGGQAEPLKRGPACHLFVSAIEHPSVLAGGGFVPEHVSHVPVTADGVVDIDRLRDALARFSNDNDGACFMVSVMAANNETGVLQPLRDVADVTHGFGGIFHSDFVQLAGKEPCALKECGADMVSLSAHKIGGPKGVGALVLASEDLVLQRPLIRGGGQEKRRRAGTENVAGIAGGGAAAEAARLSLADQARVSALKDEVEAGLTSIAGETVIFGQKAARLANTICFATPGLDAETATIALDLSGIAVSSGSACSSGKVERSHVLAAMGVPDDLNRGALRISLGWNSTKADIDKFMEAWRVLYRRHKEKRTAA